MVAAMADREQGRVANAGSPGGVRDSRRNPPHRGRTTAVTNIGDAGLKRGSSGGVAPLACFIHERPPGYPESVRE